MRKWLEFTLDDDESFIYQLVHRSEIWDHFMLLNSNSKNTAPHLYNSFEMIAACGAVNVLHYSEGDNFEKLKEFCCKNNDWVFGHFNYDLKNEIENLSSNNTDSIGFPDLFFFVPQLVFILNKDKLKIGYLPNFSSNMEISDLVNNIIRNDASIYTTGNYANNIQHNFTADEYIANVNEIKNHILKGDIYELNFCTEFSSDKAKISPSQIFKSLNTISPAPFSAFYKIADKYLISSSPERFLAKRGNKIISQPIKGTIKRGKNYQEDQKLKKTLEFDEKERAENIMIVDLVRNDLSRTAKIGSVKVEELCKTYSYKYVHQLISTVVSEMDAENFHAVDVIKNAFPMGSMTGAPKVRAMQLIEHYEKSKRGLYSGAIGYFSPENDFDFNVVIRSILYNKTKKTLSFSVGGAITFKSVPEKEYEECILKAEAMREVLTQKEAML